MSEQQAVVRLEDVTKQFGKGGVTALQDVDLDDPRRASSCR